MQHHVFTVHRPAGPVFEPMKGMLHLKSKNIAKRRIINILITLVVGLIIFYFELPAINLKNPGFYTFLFLLAALYCVLDIVTLGLHRAENWKDMWRGIKKGCAVPVLVCVALAVLFIVGSLISAPIFRAGAYSSLLEVNSGDFLRDVDEISYDQIPMLDADSAKKLGDRKMGELADMVSQFEVADNYTQINYNGSPVRVTPLEYGDIIKWFNNRSEGLPAYIIIDMVTQEVEVVRLEDGMKYSTCEHFGRNLQRHLRFNYPTYMFDEATFEIAEDGTPYWVCPRIVKRIGLFGGTDIQGAVLVNAITGECEYYEELSSEFDRLYTAELIIQQYDYYGMYQNGWLNSLFGQKDVTVTTDGYNYLAIDDDVYMYTGITSVASDESNVGFILVNQRTKETTYYSIAGAEEYSAMSSAEGIVQQYSYDSTFPLLLNISSQPTYFMALKDSAGLVKMYAMVNVQQYQVVATGATVAECERNYISRLTELDLTQEVPPETSEVSGVVTEVRTAVLGGNTRVYLRLASNDFFYVISVSDCELAAVIDVGDLVTLAVSTDEGDLRSAYDVVSVR